uniref:MORN repeat-containing protein n=1 Tax=Panagrellus redivivus TaxID=6233 RepID=A0A7E4VGP2_PANRE
MERKMVQFQGEASLAANFWKYFDRTIERNSNFAKQTCREVIELQKFVTEDIQLSKPSRLVIWSSTSNPNGTSLKIKESDAGAAYFPWRNVLGATSSGVVLAVFSDAIAVLLKNQAFVLDTPLVWVQNVAATALAESADDSEKAGNDLIVKLIAPEHEFLVEFPVIEMKNDLLAAFSSSLIYYKEKNDLCIFDDQPRLNGVPVKRTGMYEFSTAHPIYKGARYTGEWKNGKPHGEGLMIFTDGKEYKGSFVHGEIHGYGEMTVPEDRKSVSPMASVFYTQAISDRVHHFKGRWKSGKLNGLAVILYVNGDKYEGYCVNGKPHGHGVHRSVDSAGALAIYVGGWSNGQRHGYGVYSVSKDRYLGMWNNGQRHDRGCHITIDGVFHEGIFDRDRFTRGRLVTDSSPRISFEGDFEKLGYAAGKGKLKLTPDVVIDGTMNGQILSDSLNITHAVCKRTPQQERDSHGGVNTAMAESMLIDFSWGQ